ncbi:MAG: hypothetical protein NTU63_00750 [Candidatus Pacearchaeota archaeon]|nr:hypothetical protein [Candidatus Pacearchaeota archaeon]
MKKQVNVRLIILSLISLGFFALTFLVSPYFIIGAIGFMLLGQREMKRKRKE